MVYIVLQVIQAFCGVFAFSWCVLKLVDINVNICIIVALYNNKTKPWIWKITHPPYTYVLTPIV